MRSYTSGVRCLIVVSPAVIVIGLALKVPACGMASAPRLGSKSDMMSRRPPKAPAGIPPPMILPRAVRSGSTPNISCAPPGAMRRLWTSSNTSSMPRSRVRSRIPLRKPISAGAYPKFETTASMITQASSPWRSPRMTSQAARSLYGSTTTPSATDGGMPGNSGTAVGPLGSSSSAAG